MRRNLIKRSGSGIKKVCLGCKKEFIVSPCESKKYKYCSLICRSKYKRGINHPMYHKSFNYDKKLTIPENCLSLCFNCHLKTNGNRQHWIKFFQSLLSEKYGYKYDEQNNPIIEMEVGIK